MKGSKNVSLQTTVKTPSKANSMDTYRTLRQDDVDGTVLALSTALRLRLQPSAVYATDHTGAHHEGSDCRVLSGAPLP